MNKEIESFINTLAEDFFEQTWFDRTPNALNPTDFRLTHGCTDTPLDIIEAAMSLRKELEYLDPSNLHHLGVISHINGDRGDNRWANLRQIQLPDSKDFNHGFNSGVLAALRLLQSINEGEADRGLEEFPMLDS